MRKLGDERLALSTSLRLKIVYSIRLEKEMLAYKFRLYPNKEERRLLWTKEVCRHTYNRFLELYNVGEHDRATWNDRISSLWTADHYVHQRMSRKPTG